MEKPSIRTRLVQFRERLLKQSLSDFDEQIIFQFNELEQRFNEEFQNIISNNPLKARRNIFEMLFGRDDDFYRKNKSEMLNRLEIMISYFSDKQDYKVMNHIYINNFHQMIDSLNIDNSIKNKLNVNLTLLEEELKKPKPKKSKIKRIINELLVKELPKQALLYLTKILLNL